ncbi:O-antigen ligase family protein [Paenibacillus sp. J2TS4]|uniref:O-antigen ligase family protein n=1 Tax=Paenibacillus sp. J2TS4 TaxID=2807194 RepID=UPI001B0BAAD2|nr:O-antigen ligase family protein [Paenibacillus sp. J2TS4]GIP35497.1 hypothetical protein J2TS4_47070 [Paenibacillus sp. J2TS4]
MGKKFSKPRRQPMLKETSEPNEMIYWLGIGFILLFLFIAPFRTGLFNGYPLQYEGDIYSAVAWTALFYCLISLYWIFRWKVTTVRDVLTLLAWGIPLSYLLSGITAVSPYSNGKLLLLNAMYAMMFGLGAYFARNKSGNRVIQFGIMASGYIIVIYCFMNMFGNAYFPHAVMEDQGLRLTAVFQYANAYAALLIALLVGCLHFMISSRKGYVIALNALMLVPLIISFLLTLSRGGIVVLPIILLALLPFLSVVRQICFFLYLAIGFAASFLITDRVRGISLEMLQRLRTSLEQKGFADTVSLLDPLSMKGWLTLLPLTIGVSAIIVLFQLYITPILERKLARFNDWKWSNWILPVGILSLGALGILLITQGSFLGNLLPQALQQRVESINFQQHSVLERLMMFSDSLKIFADRLLLGGGGGAWEALFTTYQGAPYLPRQVHSFFLEYLDETGLVGIVFLGGLLLLLFIYYVKNVFIDKTTNPDQSILYYMVAVSILIHSILDFEMSYGYIAALVFLCLGGMASAVTSGLRLDGNKVWGWLADRTWGKAVPAVLSIASLVVLIVAIFHFQANQLFYTYVDQAGERPYQEALISLDKALKIRPNHPEFVLAKVEGLNALYGQTNDPAYLEQADTLLQQLKKKEPYNRSLFEEQYSHNLRQNQLPEALDIAYSRLESNIWGLSMFENSPNWYDRAVQLNFELGNRAGQNNDVQLQEKYWNDAVKLYETVLVKMKQLEQLPEGQMHEPFGVTPGLALYIGQIHYLHKDYEAASAVLQPLAEGGRWEAPLNRELTRLYLAARNKQGEGHAELYDKFVGQFPEEQEQIEALVQQAP